MRTAGVRKALYHGHGARDLPLAPPWYKAYLTIAVLMGKEQEEGAPNKPAEVDEDSIQFQYAIETYVFCLQYYAGAACNGSILLQHADAACRSNVQLQ